MNNVFILRVTSIEGPEREVKIEECYQSRTNAIEAMKKYWEIEKKKWIEDCEWRTEDVFDFILTSDGGHISYGWSSEYIDFTLKRLKIKDLKQNKNEKETNTSV